jgi:hypothetical protein
MKQNNIDKQINKEMTELLKTMLNQNYFQYERNFHEPNRGIGVGFRISSILLEIFPLEFRTTVNK